jgi:cytoskeletal protein CcmA (bactofilin family)
MMFTKSTDKLESLIGANSTFKGDINSKGTLRIDGNMTGNVDADWVIIGEKATLRGDISARGIVVGGKVEGNLRSKEIVEIKTKGQVVGDIAAAKLTILEGGLFEGRSMMNKSDSKIVELQQRG